MNRTDAATILSIDPSASPEEAKRAYQDLFTEHQVRLTNAPTPALRSLYQARLLELDEARDAFLAQSVSDADSDLPTDQPSIPTYGAGRGSTGPTPPPPPQQRITEPPAVQPPPRREQEPLPPPPRESIVEPRPEAAKKKGVPKAVSLVLGLAVVVLAVWQLTRLSSGGSDDRTGNDTAAAVTPATNVSDSLPKIRENITVARVEFGRGDYDAANGALKEADTFYSRLPAGAQSDSAVIQVKSQLDSLHAKVQRACDALKKVAERHPGEPTCKSL